MSLAFDFVVTLGLHLADGDQIDRPFSQFAFELPLSLIILPALVPLRFGKNVPIHDIAGVVDSEEGCQSLDPQGDQPPPYGM